MTDLSQTKLTACHHYHVNRWTGRCERCDQQILFPVARTFGENCGGDNTCDPPCEGCSK